MSKGRNGGEKMGLMPEFRTKKEEYIFDKIGFKPFMRTSKIIQKVLDLSDEYEEQIKR